LRHARAVAVFPKQKTKRFCFLTRKSIQ
jgi:hypothetical protein